MSDATKTAWRKANKEKVAAYSRRWRRKNRRHVAAKMREWRRKNAEHFRAWVVATQPARREREERRRKKVAGRVCDDCGRSDSEATWSSIKDQCAACNARERYNGRCERCDAIFVRVKTVHGPASKGIPGKKTCPDRCSERRDLTAEEIAVWDALRWSESPITFRILAAKMGVSLRTVERKRVVFLEIIRRHDPEATFGVDDEDGCSVTFVFSAKKVSAGLERMALGGVA